MKKVLLLILFLNLVVKAPGETPQPAMIRLDFRSQHDSLGYNLVRAIPILVNEGIHNGEIPLWDSPKKEKNLSGKFLIQLEQANKTRFTDQNFLFLHELWSTSRRETAFKVLGFSFIGENTADSSKFNYGYIEIGDIEILLKTKYIPINGNGNYHTTFWDALYHRDYPFNLVQLGNQYITDPNIALKNKNKFFNPNKKNISYSSIPEQKLLTCILDSATESTEIKSLFDFINTHYQDNKEDFLNHGGSLICSHLDTDYKMAFTRMELRCVWKKEGHTIQSEPEYIVLFIANHSIDTLLMKDIEQWTEQQNSKTMAQLLRANTFVSRITSINNIAIPSAITAQLLNTLRYGKWNEVSLIK